MIYNNIELRVLVKGKPVTEFPHMGQVYIEGRDGSNFEIEVKNNNHFRVEAVISVDGLSVIDGKDAGPNSSGYLIDARSSISIPGWKLTEEQVAAFQFAGKKGSYVAQATGSDRNTGVIGVLAFAEKARAYVPNQWTTTNYAIPFSAGTPFYGSPTTGGWVGVGSTAADDLTRSATIKGMALGAAPGGAALGGAMPQNMASVNMVATASLSSASASIAASPGVPVQEVDHSVVEQTLGTAFGKAQDFATTVVQFERGDMHAMIVLYYDDATGLRKRGIDVSKRARAKTNERANAFPGMNCAPPPGWRG